MDVNCPHEELGVGMCARLAVPRLTGVPWPEKLADSANPRSVGDLVLESKADGTRGMTCQVDVYPPHACTHAHTHVHTETCTHI